MSVEALSSAGATPRRGGSSWPFAVRFASRELRGRVAGFRVFLACLALGVAAIAGVGSLSRGLQEGLAREGRVILGGDASFSLVQRRATPQERALLEGRGRVSEIVSLRAMARAASGEATLVEAKAVDAQWPLVGEAVLDPAGDLAAALTPRDGAFGAAVDRTLLDRLNIKLGDRLTVGEGTFVLTAVLEKEPDALAAGLGFGPRFLISAAGLEATKLVQPGSLTRFSYQVLLPAGSAPEAADALVAEVNQALPTAGFETRTHRRATPQIERNIERFTQFLTIVGLTALLVGGVGVANAVAAHMDRKREVIATLKCLGAPGRTVVQVYLVEVVALALIGIAIGLALGLALPYAAVWFLGGLLPLPIEVGVYGREVLLALAYGLVTALAFALWPVARAHDLPVATLFREGVAPVRRWPRPAYLAAIAVAIVTLAALAVLAASDRRIALVFLAAAVGTFVGLRLVASGIMALARRLPRPRRTELRLALANIHRPSALTPSVVLSLGLGLTLLVALTQIDATLRRQLGETLPRNAPAFFFLDIPSAEANAFADFIAETAPGAEIERVPMLRGTVTALKGIPAADYPVPADRAFFLKGDRGITYAATVPENSTVAQGAWWPQDYGGEPLVSFDAELARDLNLAIGDTIEVNVLGRIMSAKIANLRDIRWETMGINFFMVFSPNMFAGAPHTILMTATLKDGGDEAERAVLREAASRFPMVTAVRVKEAIAAVNDIVGDLAIAIRGAASITLVASVLVLAGALAAGHRQRLYDAVVLKTLGAARRRLLAAFLAEYLALGAVTAVFAVLAGSLAAWAIVALVLDLPFVIAPGATLLAAFGALVLTVVLGLIGTWRILGEVPARHLRTL